MPKTLLARISKLLKEEPHPQRGTLARVLAGKTSVSSSQYPYISEASFRTVLGEVPHLFREGNRLLGWLSAAERRFRDASEFSDAERESIDRAIRVLRNIVYSAGICAPPDLWVMRHVLSTHLQAGLMPFWLSGESVRSEDLAERLGLNAELLRWDLELLHCRGYLRVWNRRYRMAAHPQARDVFRNATALPDEFLTDMTEPLIRVLRGEATPAERRLAARFLQCSGQPASQQSWFASHFDLEIGYRLVPLVLALHAARNESRPRLTPEMKNLLSHAGMLNTAGQWTDFGNRVLQRGPGPFGIIHAYAPHMNLLAGRLAGKSVSTHVDRLKNIAASRDANHKTFQMANDSLDRFCSDHHVRCTVFLEHALGQGEAVRQRFHKYGEADIQYFGADLEDAAINRAIELQREGVLPNNMSFVRNADIGIPQVVIDAIRQKGFRTEEAAMFVGNGFHEIRGQSNEKVIEIFRRYCEAGIILVFTEESALSDRDLFTTAWNTYHAGFRYVHDLSGQGLRPAYGAHRSGKYSWRICAALGGYAILQRYCVHTRTIYPYPKQGSYNPPISMTYFCVPAVMARRLGYFPTGWSHNNGGIADR